MKVVYSSGRVSILIKYAKYTRGLNFGSLQLFL